MAGLSFVSGKYAMDVMTTSPDQVNFQDSTAVTKLFLERAEVRDIAGCEALIESLTRHAADWPHQAHWLDYFGAVLKDIRDNQWAEAELTYDALLQAPSLDRFLQGEILLSLGRCKGQRGQWQEAIAHTEAALTLFQTLAEAIEEVKAWKNLAAWRMQGFSEGVFDATVLAAAQQACRNAQDILGALPASREVALYQASLHTSLANIYLSSQQWRAAEANLQASLAIQRRIGNQFGAAAAHHNLGYFYERLGAAYHTLAQEAYEHALALFRQQGNQYYTMMTCANLGHFHQHLQEHQTALTYYRESLDLIDNVRAGLTSEAARAGFLTTVANTFANAVLACIDGDEIELAFNFCERARARVLLDLLHASRVVAGDIPVATPLTLARIQAALPADALLFTYFTTGVIESVTARFANDSSAQRTSFPAATTLIFAITNSEYRWCNTRLSPNLLYPANTDTPIEDHFLDAAIRAELYECLVAPVASLLQGKQVVYIAPHGPLHFVPFHALIQADGQPLLQAGGPHLIYTPSPSSLFAARVRRQAAGTVSRLAIGYDGDAGQRLWLAEAEAEYVIAGADARAWNGPAPKKARLCREARRYRELHFSCHGAFDSDSPLDSALSIAAGEHLTAREIIEQMPLDCDLVVLSACESGLSKVHRGDEVYGLLRAFLCAGAKVVIATLWRVDERVAALFAHHFYDRLAQGATYAEALHTTQLYLQTVTRQEALSALQQVVSSVRPQATPSLAGAHPAGPAEDGALATHLLALMAGDPAEPLFADPSHWAAFILVAIAQTTTDIAPCE
jgi:CHAT domain-containing protein/tetratricopeptide (TPR) repeat protein